MSRPLWRVFVLIVFATGLAAPSARPAEQPEQPELSGLYLCEGRDAGGNEYRGLVRIARKGNTLVLTWMFPEIHESSTIIQPAAVGIVTGNSLAVSYYSPTMASLAVYRIEEDDRRLVGQWTVAGGDGALYPETLTRLAALAAPRADERMPGREKKTPAVRESVEL